MGLGCLLFVPKASAALCAGLFVHHAGFTDSRVVLVCLAFVCMGFMDGLFTIHTCSFFTVVFISGFHTSAWQAERVPSLEVEEGV